MALAKAKDTTGIEHQKSAQTETRQRGKDIPIASLILGGLSFLGMMVSLWMIFLYAPTDALQGDAQRIFYFHVPMAWVGMLSFVILTVAGIVYLWKGDERWDWLARAAETAAPQFAWHRLRVVQASRLHLRAAIRKPRVARTTCLSVLRSSQNLASGLS